MHLLRENGKNVDASLLFKSIGHMQYTYREILHPIGFSACIINSQNIERVKDFAFSVISEKQFFFRLFLLVISTRERYAHVQSSGYGRPTSPSSKRPRSRSASSQKSPAKGQSLREDTSPRRTARERTIGGSSPAKAASPRGTMKERYRSKLFF